MNANDIINENMSLEEKLSAIDSAVRAAQQTMTQGSSTTNAPLDPSTLTICDGCE